MIQQLWTRPDSVSGPFGSRLPCRTRQRNVAWMCPAGQPKPVVKVEVPEGGVEVVPPHQLHHPAAEPDAFWVGGRPAQDLRGFGKFIKLLLAFPVAALLAWRPALLVSALRRCRAGCRNDRTPRPRLRRKYAYWQSPCSLWIVGPHRGRCFPTCGPDSVSIAATASAGAAAASAALADLARAPPWAIKAVSRPVANTNSANNLGLEPAAQTGRVKEQSGKVEPERTLVSALGTTETAS